MDQKQLQQLFEKYLNGTATAHEKQMVEAWLLITEKEEPPSFILEKEDIKVRIWAKLRPGELTERPFVQKPLRWGNRNKWLQRAAVWLVLVVSAVTGYMVRDRLRDVFAPVAKQVARTGPYEIKQVRLPDSSLVTLAPNSSIAYPVRGDRRSVTLNGKAFFEVRHNASATFLVKSNDIDIKVLGTSFEVSDMPAKVSDTPAGNEAIVTVVTGSIKVSHENNTIALLTYNQQLRYHKSSGSATISGSIDANRQTAWINNRLVFEAASLEAALQSVADSYGLHLALPAGLVPPGANFSGSFTNTESLEDVLKVICLSADLSYSITGDHTIYIKRKSSS